MPFFKPSSQKKLKKFFKKHDFILSEGGDHALATHERTGQVFAYPRHNSISSGVTKAICDRLILLGYDKAEIERDILK